MLFSIDSGTVERRLIRLSPFGQTPAKSGNAFSRQCFAKRRPRLRGRNGGSWLDVRAGSMSEV
jgi:hypothetical protein